MMIDLKNCREKKKRNIPEMLLQYCVNRIWENNDFVKLYIGSRALRIV